jgi:hypothetical protein
VRPILAALRRPGTLRSLRIDAPAHWPAVDDPAQCAAVLGALRGAGLRLQRLQIPVSVGADPAALVDAVGGCLDHATPGAVLALDLDTGPLAGRGAPPAAALDATWRALLGAVAGWACRNVSLVLGDVYACASGVARQRLVDRYRRPGGGRGSCVAGPMHAATTPALALLGDRLAALCVDVLAGDGDGDAAGAALCVPPTVRDLHLAACTLPALDAALRWLGSAGAAGVERLTVECGADDPRGAAQPFPDLRGALRLESLRVVAVYPVVRFADAVARAVGAPRLRELAVMAAAAEPSARGWTLPRRLECLTLSDAAMCCGLVPGRGAGALRRLTLERAYGRPGDGDAALCSAAAALVAALAPDADTVRLGFAVEPDTPAARPLVHALCAALRTLACRGHIDLDVRGLAPAALRAVQCALARGPSGRTARRIGVVCAGPALAPTLPALVAQCEADDPAAAAQRFVRPHFVAHHSRGVGTAPLMPTQCVYNRYTPPGRTGRRTTG